MGIHPAATRTTGALDQIKSVNRNSHDKQDKHINVKGAQA
jgi:hypothetical protein